MMTGDKASERGKHADRERTKRFRLRRIAFQAVLPLFGRRFFVLSQAPFGRVESCFSPLFQHARSRDGAK
jgi:hypothetical protein